MRRFVVAGVFVLASTAVFAGKTWDYMNADERLAWASRQVPRICGKHGLALRQGETSGLMRAGIMLVSQATVLGAIRERCTEKRASR